MLKLVAFLIFFINFTKTKLEYSNDVSERILKYEPKEIADNKLSVLTKLSDVNNLKDVTEKILIPRIVGTKGHDKVRDFLVSSMEQNGWNVQINNFTDKTPNFGKLRFENIIATLNPEAERYLVLACHYDSKYTPDFEFLGATDSAVPCAMLINLATVMKSYLDTIRKNKINIMFIFFDGEEAFKEWGPDDSIYGARHLATKWYKEGFLNRIDMLILLDLIGAPDPKFYSFFPDTEKWFIKFVNIEEKLASKGFLEHYTMSGTIRNLPNRYFQLQSANSYIEDDHIPFLNLGVPIMHLITVPFPDFWHTADDNADAIDYQTVENLNRILRIFVAEYLQIKI